MGETLVAVLTPPGQSALATIGVRGPLAWPVLRELFTPRAKALPEGPEVGRFWLGKVGAEIADEAVLAVRANGLELYVHGGREVTRYVVELLVGRGMRLCGWEEYLKEEPEARAREAATLARASGSLARTRTLRTAAIVLDQCQGALQCELQRADDALARGDRTTGRAILEALLTTAPLPITRPARVVVAGAPNVGKSSLINALAGYQRSVVSPTPGTTRDVTTTETAIDGWPVELVDTAGLRASGDALEAEGIGLAREAIEAAHVCLWLLDASAEPVWPERVTPNLHLILNKCDLPAGWDLSTAGDAPRVSATTGAGIPELLAALSRWVVPCPPDPGAAVLLDDAQVAEVRGRIQSLLR